MTVAWMKVAHTSFAITSKELKKKTKSIQTQCGGQRQILTQPRSTDMLIMFEILRSLRT